MKTTTRWLRVEGAAVLVAVLVAYAATGSSWLLFAGLFLVPDLAMAGYLAGPGVGAVTYNAAHLYVWPALLLALAAAGSASWALAPGLVWAAHIALDRALGYGLKEPDSFQHTHLGWIGGATAPAAQPESSSTIGR